MLIHSGLFVIVLGFVGFFSAKSFHRYISLPASFLLLVLALFVNMKEFVKNMKYIES